jgi:hypothetical protein
MKFYAIKPAECAIEAVEARAPFEAYHTIGLKDVDHGIICRGPEGGIGIVVYEYSLFVPVDEQRWFSIGGKLYGGNALLYGFDAGGETCEFDPPPPVVFYGSADAVEAAITRGEVERPIMAVNKAVYWRWPEPQPR